jgi:hypothetical protein
MFNALRWIAKQIGTYWDALSSIFTWAFPIVGGLVSAWLAWLTDRLNAYAPLSWLAAGLFGGLICAGIAWLVGRARWWMIQARWANLLNSPGEGVNPLDDNFVRRRIKIDDFVSPVHPSIQGKSFDRCELIGPAVVLMGSSVFDPLFFDCNFICVKDNVNVYNAIVISDYVFLRCKFYRLSLLVPESVVNSVPPVPWLSRVPTEFGLPVPWTGGNAVPPAAQPTPAAKPASERSFPPPL